MPDARRLVDKLWSYANVLRDDGVGTIHYTEQLTEERVESDWFRPFAYAS